MFGVARTVKTIGGAVKGAVQAKRTGGDVLAGAAAGGARSLVEGGRFLKKVPGLADRAASAAHSAVAGRPGGSRMNHFNDGHQGAKSHGSGTFDWGNGHVSGGNSNSGNSGDGFVGI